MGKTNLKGIKRNAIEFKLKTCAKFQTSAGSRNPLLFKTVYYQQIFHFESLSDNPIRTLSNFTWGVRQTIAKAIKDDIFHRKFLVDIQYPDTFKNNCFACIKLEFTFFPNDIYTKKQIVETLDLISEKCMNNNFINTKDFALYRMKSEYKELK